MFLGLNLLDLSTAYIKSPFEFGEDLETYLDEIDLMKMFVDELSKPAISKDPYFDYLPTQYLSEFIKHEKYDGYMFKSSLDEGINFVIFNHEKVECTKVDYKPSFACEC